MTLVYICAFVVLAISILLYIFPVMLVVGPSMEPTLYDGDIAIGCRIVRNPKVGNIYVFRPPIIREGKVVIKRLVEFNVRTQSCYFRGDNALQSLDSRCYGYVYSKSIVARYLFTIKEGVKENER